MARRIALVGCGAVSRQFYVPACRNIQDCEIKWFVDADLDRAKELARVYGRGNVTRDHKETIGSVDAAIIALPNHLHAETSLDFLRGGRDVLCEKPITTNSSDALMLAEASQETGARLAVNMIRRRFRSNRIAKELLAHHTLGKLESVTFEEGQMFNWPLTSSFLLDRSKAGGGVLMDSGIHALDLLKWMFDGSLNLVSYEDDSLGGVEANCNVELRIVTASAEIPCQVALGRTRLLANRLVVKGDKLCLEIRQSNPNGVYLLTQGKALKIESEDNQNIPHSGVDYFAEQLTAFLDRSSTDLVNASEALESLYFIEECYKNKRRMEYPWVFKSKPKVKPTIPHYGRVLVVGASGFLGTRIVERLSIDSGLGVRATIHRPENAVRLARLGSIQFVDCDILDEDQVQNVVNGCDAVINCSRDRSGEKKRGLDVSIKGTSNLLEAAVKHHIKKYIHISTAAVHGFSPKDENVNEESPLTSSFDPYIRGKIRSEQLVMKYSRYLPVVILRPTLIYGPYSSNWTVDIIERLKNHLTTVIGENGVANLIYVDDVVEAIVASLVSDEANGETFILNNDCQQTLWIDVTREYSKLLGTPPKKLHEFNLAAERLRSLYFMIRDSIVATDRIIKSSELLALTAQIPLVVKIGSRIVKGEKRRNVESRLSTIRDMPRPDRNILNKYEVVSKQYYDVLTCRLVFSAAKARKVLGFEPTPFDQGIAETLEWATWAGYAANTNN